MSEVTTGSVPVSIISAPLAIGAALIGAAYFAAKYCGKQYDKMLKEVEESDTRLKWLDKHNVASPKKMAEEANRLQKLVADNNTFKRMTCHMSVAQKEILAGVIATESSPLSKHVPTLLAQMPEQKGAFEMALGQGAKNLALDNFAFVNNVVKEAASAVGFASRSIVLKQSNSVLDVVFVDEKNRRFTAYCRIDKHLNPSLALDLEGFTCDSDECSLKMEEIIRYLHEHGVPFRYKRMKHNQPTGVLRKLLKRRAAARNDEVLKEYFHGGGNQPSRQLGSKVME